MKREITKTQNKNRKGFTLVELVVVIAILAVLSVGAITGYSNVRDGADEAVAKANASVIVNSLNTFNTLAHTDNQITTTTAATYAKLTSLVLDTDDGDLVSMDLSISATNTEYTAAIAYVDYTSRWVVK